jgi:hypothetical protein
MSLRYGLLEASADEAIGAVKKHRFIEISFSWWLGKRRLEL